MRFSGDTAVANISQLKFGSTTISSGANVLGHHSGIDYFYKYYQQISEECDGKPNRKDLNPTDIKKYLPHIVLMDIENYEPLLLRVRLIGTRVSEVYGEMTGKLTDQLPNKMAAERIKDMSKRCIETEKPVLNITPGIGPNQEHLMAFACYMPLFDQEGNPAIIICAIFIENINID